MSCREPLVLWQCAVLFTDNSALGGTLKQLNVTHQAKIARRDEILELLRQATSVREVNVTQDCLSCQ